MNQPLSTILSSMTGPAQEPLEQALTNVSGLIAALAQATIDDPPVKAIEATLAQARAMPSVEPLLRGAVMPASAQEIRHWLEFLVAAWPNASQNDLAGYGAQLSQDVSAARPSRYALDASARTLRREAKFLPSISEVLGAIQAAEQRLFCAVHAHEHLPEWLDRAQDALAAAHRRQRRRELNRSAATKPT